MIYKYYININERGDFNADVRAPDGTTVFEIQNADHMWELVEDGFMHDGEDISGLFEHLCTIGLVTDNDRIVSGN